MAYIIALCGACVNCRMVLHLHIVCALCCASSCPSGRLDVVAVVLPPWILLRNNVLGGLYVVWLTIAL